MSDVRIMQPFGVDIDLVEGVMADHDRYLSRNVSAMKGHYRDEAACCRARLDGSDTPSLLPAEAKLAAA